jgi:glycosyltransferase involved in cell wall biosynthesis
LQRRCQPPAKINEMRILLLTDGIFPFVIGGMQKHAYYLAKNFLKRGVDLTVFHCLVDRTVPDDIDQQLRKSLEVKEGQRFSSKCFTFPRLKIGVPGHYVIESYLYSKVLYDELVKEKKFDFIYAKGLTGWYSLTHKTGLPKIGLQLHGLEMFQPASSFIDYLQKFSLRSPVKINLRKADYVFTYGGKIRELHKKLGCEEQKLVLQHGGIDEALLINEDNIPTPRQPRRFIFIGRNERRKGYSELKSALENLLNKYAFEFSFIGDIAGSDRIISERIKYYGVIDVAESYYKIIDSHDVLVVPSISEGLPTVIIECMARGLAVIATDVGAVNEIVKPANGILIEAGNVGQLEDAIISMITVKDEDLSTKKKKSLDTARDHFNWDKLSESLLRFIASIKSN